MTQTPTTSFRRTWIGFSGKRRSGKDTSANILTTYLNKHTPDFPVYRLAFADALKDEVCEKFGITREELESKKEFYRSDLQGIGETRRNEREDYWIGKLFAKVNSLPQVHSYVMITDVRHLNEAKVLQAIGAHLFRVIRPMPSEQLEGADKHISEVALDGFMGWNGIIRNDGGLRTLENRVKRLADCWFEGRLYTI